ncbi:PhzF family phenazine biosynthesis protein [Caldibacillus debilis]|uniref:PhzF family phenazine biosynthesis protein n=1 Tax=Caldibacillus debilis TaxID=301148 RepID=UPI0023F30C9A|nr:PhzF family phenazine biosynthesis protein [Caldibacillus debilis]
MSLTEGRRWSWPSSIPLPNKPFKGTRRPCACWVGEKDGGWMQKVAKEIHMPVTVFIRRHQHEFRLRWFTPAAEIPICGHGTPASSFFLRENGHAEKEKPIAFRTKSGVLRSELVDGWVRLAFPSMPPERTPAPDLLVKALGVEPVYVGESPTRAMVARIRVLWLSRYMSGKAGWTISRKFRRKKW